MNLFYEQLERECDPDLIHLDLAQEDMRRIIGALYYMGNKLFLHNDNPYTQLANKLTKVVK